MARRKIGTNFPPPEQRLCSEHQRPICPRRWKQGYRSKGCCLCNNIRTRSVESKNRRTVKWESIFIPCIHHPDRRCNRSNYVISARRKCGSCSSTRANGEKRRSYVRNLNKTHHKRSMRSRERGGTGNASLSIVQIWERCTGMTAEFPRRVNG